MADWQQAEFMRFIKLLQRATSNIKPPYIQLPVAGKESPEYRERVYCYELYHQLRLVMEEAKEFKYSLGGEIDKGGHPYIRGDILDKVKPDLVVHEPGLMENNLVAIEVKPINARKRGIKKDLESLTAYRTIGQYYRAIYLFYGGNEKAIDRISRTARSLSTDDKNAIDLGSIDLYWHSYSGQPAIRIDWPNIL